MAAQRVTTRRHFVEDYKRSQLSLTDDLSLYLSQLIGRAKSVASNIFEGLHKRPKAGMGDVFWQYRLYSAGDDPNRIDWKRSGRADQIYIRELQLQSPRNYYLWIDCAPSMAFSSNLAEQNKLSRAIMLALILAEILVRGGDRVALIGVMKPTQNRQIMDHLCYHIYEQIIEKKSNPLSAENLISKSHVILLSDFLSDTTDLQSTLLNCSKQNCGGQVIMISDPCEYKLPFNEESLFVATTEDSDYYAGNPQSLQTEYQNEYAKYCQQIKYAAQSASFSYLYHSTDQPISRAINKIIDHLYD